MKAWQLVSHLDNICKFTWTKQKKNLNKKSIFFFNSFNQKCLIADVRFVLFAILIIECRTVAGLNTTVTTDTVPSTNNFNCTDGIINNTNDHKIDFVRGDVVISVISINPIPSQYLLKRVSDSVNSKLSIGKFLIFV